MSSPATTVQMRVLQQSLTEGVMRGEIHVESYQWTFSWNFRLGQLMIHPTRGRALVQEPLKRFLEHQDYALELGEVYSFVLRTKL